MQNIKITRAQWETFTASKMSEKSASILKGFKHFCYYEKVIFIFSYYFGWLLLCFSFLPCVISLLHVLFIVIIIT